MLCKGNVQAMQIMLSTFHSFSKTTRISVNPANSSFYCCGMDENTKDSIGRLSGLSFDDLPFIYFWVLISTKKLQASECEKLVNKMVTKIKIWSLRHLSFTWTMYLVNLVLMSTSVYWNQIFILPKKVINRINAVFIEIRYLSVVWHLWWP